MTTPLNVDRLRAYQIPPARDDYDPRDAIIYALGVGAGLCPEIDETRFLYERILQPLPTMALVLGTAGFWPMDPRTGIDWLSIVHAEQRLRLFRPLDPADTLTGETVLTALADKGPGKGAFMLLTKQLRSLGSSLVAEAIDTWMIRGAGGFGGDRGLPGAPLPAVPDRAPDTMMSLPTSRAQGATYRLSGDRNPLHVDPAAAARAGYDRPVLHGLSSLGVAARAVIHAMAGGDASCVSSIAARFTAPVMPGDTIRTDLWNERGAIHFRSWVDDVLVIDCGHAELDRFDG